MRRKWIYGIRTVGADMTSYGGFVWPEKGRVEAPDWDATNRCGGGLHFLPAGVGLGSLLNWTPEAKWLVVRADASLVVEITEDGGGKSKAPWCEVVCCGTRDEAMAWLRSHCQVAEAAIVCGITGATGDRGAASATGYRGAASATGDSGAASATGDRGAASATGYSGAASATGYRGAASATGKHGLSVGFMARAGEIGMVAVWWWDGARYRLTVGYVGEDGIEAGKWYSVQGGKLVEVSEPEQWADAEARMEAARKAGEGC